MRAIGFAPAPAPAPAPPPAPPAPPDFKIFEALMKASEAMMRAHHAEKNAGPASPEAKFFDGFGFAH